MAESVFLVKLDNELISYPMKHWDLLKKFYFNVLYGEDTQFLPKYPDGSYYVEFRNENFDVKIYAVEVAKGVYQGEPNTYEFYQVTSITGFNKSKKRRVYVVDLK